jgi:hypothetical protein
MFNIFLRFSDAAKFADIASNLAMGRGYGSDFSFFGSKVFENLSKNLFSAAGILPVMPFSIVAFFKIFGVSDFAVIATSFFYFILTLVLVFLLGRKIFKSNLVGVLSILAVGFNYDLINYATNGASESPFIFEIVAASYFVSLRKKWSDIVTVLFLILMYFTRPQAFIYIAGIVLYWLLLNFKAKKVVLTFLAVLVAGFLVDHFVLASLSGRFFLYSVTARGVNSALAQASSTAASNALRGMTVASGGGLVQIAKNIFYNLYNFYKLLPQIMNPYLVALFVIGFFVWKRDIQENSFKIASLFMVKITFLVAAASIPFFRYLHPVVPLVYIIAAGTLVEIISKSEFLISNQARIFNFKISKQAFTIVISTFLILFFAVGQTVGVLALDSRFERNTHNVGKSPVYVILSQILKENTSSNQVVITNLDTWGSWCGERKTVWFPLEPKQLIDPSTGKIPFDAIYLTSYLINDPNYYMGADWRMIFENPKDTTKWTCDGCGEMAKEFSLKGTYIVNAADDYERQDAISILLVKND